MKEILSLRYCPSWTAAKKKGRPKADNHEKSLVDHISESAKKKRGRRTNFYGRICHKFAHNMVDCFQNPANCQQSTLEEATDEFSKDGQEGKV